MSFTRLNSYNHDMGLIGTSDFNHDQAPRTGVLLVNLGTPDAPTTAAVRRYLAEFLRDQRVIELSPWVWWPILYGFILNVRPRQSAAAYRKIWTDAGSPLLTISRAQAHGIAQRLQARSPDTFVVQLGMRYGNPSLASALEKLRVAGISALLVLPLYPQYSSTTTGSTFAALSQTIRRWRWVPELRFVSQYHDRPGYLTALAASVNTYQGQHSAADRLLFSFHGIPEKYCSAGDPYDRQCRETARLVAEKLGLDDDGWAISFQSRVGPAKWLKPYTEELLRDWAAEGVRSVQVLCPGFAADCLETLEEIALRYRATFLEAGGESLRYIPALNDRDDHLNTLTDLIVDNTPLGPVAES